MAHKCCNRRCDGEEKCTVAFLCDRCEEPIDDEEDYYKINGERLCENCWDKYVDDNFRDTAHKEED